MGTKVVALILLLLPAIASAAGLGVYNPAQHAVNGFMPTQLPGLQLWLDAGRQGYTNGTSVDKWNDFSPVLKHATNASSSTRPSFIVSAHNGRSAVRFDGTDDFLQCTTSVLKTNAVGFVCIVAIQRITNGSSQNFIGQRLNGVTWRWSWAYNIDSAGSALTNSINTFHHAATSGAGSGGLIKNITNTPPELLVILNNSGGNENGKTYSKGQLEDGFTMQGAADLPLMVGSAGQAGNFWNGDILEVAIGTNALDAFSVSQIQRYLGTKYGIVVQ